MGADSKIEWTDHTFNPWIGCSKVHGGCTNCYAEELMANRYGKVQWGPNGTRVMTSPTNWVKPLLWNRQANAAGVRAKVFCASLADVFEDWHGGRDGDGAMTCHKTGEDLSVNANGHVWPAGWPSMSDGDDWGIRPFTMQDARRRLFALIDKTPHLDWLLLTKRPENVLRMWPKKPFEDSAWNGTLDGYWHRVEQQKVRQNVFLGTSVSDQASADKQIPDLLKCRDLCPVLFLSAEPLLGPVDLSVPWEGESELQTLQADWVIVGGESGHGARPMHPQWARDIRDQCQAAGVPFFFKQWGEWVPAEDGSSPIVNGYCHEQPGFRRVGKKAAGRLLDGREWSEFPETVTA